MKNVFDILFQDFSHRLKLWTKENTLDAHLCVRVFMIEMEMVVARMFRKWQLQRSKDKVN